MVLPSQTIDCDLLIIGGSIAALVAALEARKSLEKIVVVCKRKAGRSGNAIVAGSAFSACVPGGPDGDTPDQHFRDMIEGGGGINDPDLARTLSEQGGEAVMQLEEYGVRFLRADGTLVRRKAPGHSRFRQLPINSGDLPFQTRGLAITLPLVESVEKQGITVLSNQTVHRLLVREGVACGALALDPNTGVELAIHAGAVVLAAGGGGQLFSTTNNTVDATGDSYALALEAGVTLRDMEFVQFYPGNLAKPVHSTFGSGLFGEGAVLRNARGERFMPRYDPVKADMATRDVMARAIFHEVQSGNGVLGGVYVDLTPVPRPLLAKKFPRLDQMLRTHGVDPTRQYLVVYPAAHFFLGGAWIDTHCRTNVEGLFVAGEAAGGVNGANRLAGNALTETAVFGRIAGQQAARYVGRLHARPDLPARVPDLPAKRSGSMKLAEVRAELRRAMWDHSGIVRTGAGLLQAQGKLRQCRKALPACGVSTPQEVARLMEIDRMALVGLAVTSAALKRTESRGGHFRTDYPDRDDARWFGSSRMQKTGEDLRIDFVPLSR